ncbi:MAG: DegV family protein [Chloroflexi bacterium]|nr:MAG: hypothetical protein CUN54_04980 [Phototrophicales bacterium]RMF78360.1 MAG: DegV family protein [Chloroflexota bacterium]
MTKIRFVTDSTCDIPTDLIEKWHIGVVPAFVNYGGESYADDGIELIRAGFYETLPSIDPLPTTAAPSPALAEQVIKATFEDAEHIFILTAPAKLSGIYNTLRLAATEVLPKGSFTMIDSGTVSMALGWQVLIGAEVAAETGDVAAVKNAIERVREESRLYGALATLEFLRRGGRVGWASASLGSLLRIKPIISVEDGEVNSLERIRTFSRAVNRLAELARQHAPLDKLAIGHGNNPEGAQQLQDLLADIAPPDTILFSITPVIGVHSGPGVVGVGVVGKSWRQ